MEAMRDARPGMAEYELQAVAEYVFTKGGAFGPAYFALVATGTNTYYSHYHRNTAILRDGDLVQFDYAPDYKSTSRTSRACSPRTAGSRRASASSTRSTCGCIARS